MILSRFKQAGATYTNKLNNIIDLVKEGFTVSSAPVVVGSPYGNAIRFDGADDKVSLSNSTIKVNSVSFFVRSLSGTEQFIDFDGGTHYIDVSSNTVRGQGFTSPTIYVNGKPETGLTTGQWSHICITTATQFTTSNLQIGTDNVNYGNVEVCNLTIWDRILSAAEALSLYNQTTFNYMDNLVAHWDMSEINPINKSPKTYGSLNGTGTSIVAADIVNGHNGRSKAIQFDGVNDYVTVLDTSLLNITERMSVFAWVNPTSVNAVDYWGSQYDSGLSKTRWLAGTHNINPSLMRVIVSETSPLTNFKDYSSSISAYIKNTWSNVGFTWNLGDLKLFINGLENSNPTKTRDDLFTTISPVNVNLGIGSNFNNTSSINNFQGRVSLLLIFDTALTPMQWRDLYERTKLGTL